MKSFAVKECSGTCDLWSGGGFYVNLGGDPLLCSTLPVLTLEGVSPDEENFGLDADLGPTHGCDNKGEASSS